LTAVIEAILFASGEPMSISKLSAAVNAPKSEVSAALEQLRNRYEDEDCGLSLLRLDDSYQIAAKTRYADYIRTAAEIKRQTPLSAAAMEVLAIISYNQPVSKSFVEQVRGIDSGSVVNTLAERGLIEEAGRLDLPGRPIAYRTTDVFLRSFGLSRLSELPPLPGEEEQLTFNSEPETENFEQPETEEAVC